MLKKETLKRTLLNIVDAIDNGNTDYTEDEMNEVLDTINRVTNTKNKLSKYQACSYLNISRATFDNWVRAGKIPEGKKEAGFKEKFWELHTLKEIKDER